MSLSNPSKSPQEAGLREQVQKYIEAAYLNALPVENLDTGELEPPSDISDLAWITDTIMQAVKAELGAAEKMAELYGRLHQTIELFQQGKLSAESYSSLHENLTGRISELRDHFGIWGG